MNDFGSAPSHVRVRPGETASFAASGRARSDVCARPLAGTESPAALSDRSAPDAEHSCDCFDMEAAVRRYRAEATRGNALAQFTLGVLYDLGRGVEQDATRAARWFYCAAMQGNAAAQNKIGVIVERGGGSGSLAHAAEWYRLSAEQGNAAAQCNLAAMYSEGRGVGQDHATALAWYCASAQQGFPEAQTRLRAISPAAHDGQ